MITAEYTIPGLHVRDHVIEAPLDWSAEGGPTISVFAREVVARLPERDPVLVVGPHTLQVRGHAAVVDGRVVELPPGPIGVLRALAGRPGTVVSRADLVQHLPGGGDEHAVEMAVARLRAALGAPLIGTVVKRGYRLAA